MARLLIGVLVGLLVGAGGAFYFLAAPRSAQVPGEPIQPPDPAAVPGTARIVLPEQFFNEVLAGIFRDMSSPAFPLTLSGQPTPPGQECKSELKVLPNGSGVQTSVRFDNNTLSAPLAFSGNYDSMFGCLQFTGWAETAMELRYDAGARTVFGHVRINAVNLDGVNPVVGGLLTPLVQSTLNTRVNPVQIVDGRQISVTLPIAATNSSLNASVKDIRAEVRENALHLYVMYEFQGAPLQAAH